MLRNASNLSYDIPANIKDEQIREINKLENKSGSDLVGYLHENEIGKDQSFRGPFGGRKIVYCDWSASGRGLKFINDYINEEVLPWYANTHSMANTTATQISMFREEARQIVRHTVNANSDKDSVIFHGNGTTGVVSLLRHIIDAENSIFIVGEETHHSLYTPWRDVTQNVLLLADTPDKGEQLEQILVQIRAVDPGVVVFGCFAGVSNVTGAVYDVDKLAQILHLHNAHIIVDYASGAPYIEMNMNPIIGGAYKDVIVFSPHKFLGGVETPGVLVIKKNLFRNSKPFVSGGGTVFYVKEDETRYFKAPELREEGGTPNIIGSIRAALACYVKLNVGVQTIMYINQNIVDKVRAGFSDTPNLILLDDLECAKIPLFSFLIQHDGLYLHHNYVVTLLNDLFGIQTRGGCLCAGPYVQRLLGLDTKLNNAYLKLLSEDPNLDRHHLRRTKEYSSHEIFRPGVARLSISYTTPSEVVDFVVRAVRLVAEQGWKLLPFYRCNHETGEWHHLNNLQFNNRRWLAHLKLGSGGVRTKSFPVESYPDLEECLKKAEEVFKGITRYSNVQGSSAVFQDANDLRWFLLPADVVNKVNASQPILTKAPFIPSMKNKTDSDDTIAFRNRILDQILYYCKSSAEQKPLSIALTKTSHPGAAPFPLIHYSLTFLNSLVSFPFNILLYGLTFFSRHHLNKTPAIESTENLLSVSSSSHNKTSDHTILEVDSKNGTQADSVVFNAPASPANDNGTVKCPVISSKPKEPEIAKWHAPTKSILKPMMKAIEEYQMILNGDKVLLCLSGGKDSLSLLHALRQFQFIAKKKGVVFELGAVTVDPMTPTFNPAPLIPYLKELGVPYLFERQGILKQAEEMEEVSSICSLCSRMKRGRIYAAARAHGYNVIAMGQHLDDLCESFFMSIFHNGLLRTMKANYTVTEGDLRVIRPLVYVRERDLRTFAETKHLPVIAENCPACFEEPKERHRVKQLLAQQELLFPNLANSLQRAMKPLYSKHKVGMESRPITMNGTIPEQNGHDNKECIDIDLSGDVDGTGDDLMFPDGC